MKSGFSVLKEHLAKRAFAKCKTFGMFYVFVTISLMQ